VLERLTTPEARQFIEELAKVTPDAHLTHEGDTALPGAVFRFFRNSGTACAGGAASWTDARNVLIGTRSGMGAGAGMGVRRIAVAHGHGGWTAPVTAPAGLTSPSAPAAGTPGLMMRASIRKS
jgi:hypothetical protein